MDPVWLAGYRHGQHPACQPRRHRRRPTSSRRKATKHLPHGLAVDAPTVTKAEGKASAAKTQKQTGKTILVKLRIEAKERLTAKARGQIRVNTTYKLKPQTVDLARGDTKKLRLKPKQAKSKRILDALKRGEKARAKLKVKLTDPAGNTKTQKLRVKLKAQARSKGR